MTPSDARRRALTAAARWLPACTRRPAAWFSDDAEDRWYAAQHCRACPIKSSCADLGRDQAHGIWAGESVGERFELEEPVVEHVPSRGAYVAGCRCSGCERENTAYVARWRARPAPVTAAPTMDTEQLAIEWSGA